MAVSELAKKKCVPCSGDTPKLAGKALDEFVRKLGGEWTVKAGRQLEKQYTFKDFAGALGFTNRVGAIAEREGHHPDICLGWGRVTLTIWTHAIDGLSESDFILAAKADETLAKRS
jgi:4a-hydroxytetrahydrobiopterin dehydratase